MRRIFLFGFSLSLLFLISPSILRAETPVAVTEVKTYDELRRAISRTRAESRTRVEKAVEQEKVREAWEIGRLIDAHVLQRKERADYDKEVISRLAADLGMSDSELYRMLKFYRAYPKVAPAPKLSWAHYRELLSVDDSTEREALAEQAEKENWTRDRLREEIKKRKAALKGTGASGESVIPVPVEKIDPVPHSGSPGTYKIILAKTGPYAGELAIDLGFSNYARFADVLSDTTPFKEGEVISFLKQAGEVLKSQGPNPESRLYTYRAWVTRVLDGDTIEAVVDLGFGFTTTQVLRLRGIDCSELVTKEGKEAKGFVEELLKISEDGGRLTDEKDDDSVMASAAGAKQSIFIKTSKSDKYDRYLVDVFITDPTGEEQYLNNLLLEKGYAVRVRE